MNKFIDSDKIRVYTTPYRTTNKAKTKTFDPESRLYTEESVRRIYETFNTYVDDKVTNSKGSFIITDNATWLKNNKTRLEFFIAGYYVCIGNPSFDEYPVYANICITGTEVVDNWRDYHLSYISDSGETGISVNINKTDFDDSDQTTNKFHGIVFTKQAMETASDGTVYSLQLLDENGNICKNNLLKFASKDIFGGKDYDDVTWTANTNKSLEELLASEKTYTSEIRGYKLNPEYNLQQPESKRNQKFIQSDLKISANNNKISLIGKSGIIETNNSLYKEMLGKVIRYYNGSDTTGDKCFEWNVDTKLLDAINIQDIKLNNKSKFSIDSNYLLNIQAISNNKNYLHLNTTDLTSDENISLGTDEKRFRSLYLSSKNGDKFQIGKDTEAQSDVDIFAKSIDIKGKSTFKNTHAGASIEIGVFNGSTEKNNVKITASDGILLENDTTIKGNLSVTDHKVIISGIKDGKGNITDALKVTGNSELNGNVKITGNINFIGSLDTTGKVTSKNKFSLLDGSTEKFSVDKSKITFLGSSIEGKNAKAEFKELKVNSFATVVGETTFQDKVNISKDLTIKENLNISDGKSINFNSSRLTAGSDKKLSYDGDKFETKNINVTNNLTVANKIKTNDLEVTNAKTLYVHNIYLAGDVQGSNSWESQHEKIEDWETYKVVRHGGDFNIAFSFINTRARAYDKASWSSLVDDLIKICGENSPEFRKRNGFTWWNDEKTSTLSNWGNRACTLPASGYVKDDKDRPAIHVSACRDKPSKDSSTADEPYIVVLFETDGGSSILDANFIKADDITWCDGKKSEAQPQISDTVYPLKFF